MTVALQTALRSSPAERELAFPVGPLLRSVQDARTKANQLLAGDQLNEVVDRIAATAMQRGHAHVYAGTPFGFMLVGALVSRWRDLKPWVPGTLENVLLLDGPVAGAAGLVHSAEVAKAMGAKRIDAVTVGSSQDLASPAIPLSTTSGFSTCYPPPRRLRQTEAACVRCRAIPISRTPQ